MRPPTKKMIGALELRTVFVRAAPARSRHRVCRGAIDSRVNRKAGRKPRTYRADGASRGPKIAGRSGGRGTDFWALRGRMEAGAVLIAEALPVAVMVSPT